MAGLFGGFGPYQNLYGYGGYGTGNGVGYTTAAPSSYGPLSTQATPQIPTMQPQPTPQSFTPQSNIIWVNNEQEINNYPSGRGWQQLFGDKNKNMFYIRETDLNGVTQPIRRLSYTFEDQVPQQQIQPQAQAQQQDLQTTPQQSVQENLQTVPNAVSREEFDQLAKAVNLMTDKLSDLLK